MPAISIKSPETKVFTAHVPLVLAEQIDAAVLQLDRSRGWVIKQALTAWLEQEALRHQLTLDALADVDASRLVEHDQVKRWAASLGTDKPLPMPK